MRGLGSRRGKKLSWTKPLSNYGLAALLSQTAFTWIMINYSRLIDLATTVLATDKSTWDSGRISFESLVQVAETRIHMIPGNAGLDSTFNHHEKGFFGWFYGRHRIPATVRLTNKVTFEDFYAEKVLTGTGSGPQASRCLLNWLFANIGSQEVQYQFSKIR